MLLIHTQPRIKSTQEKDRALCNYAYSSVKMSSSQLYNCSLKSQMHLDKQIKKMDVSCNIV